MSSRSSFFRKIVYLVVIAALLLPLRWLSHPATVAVKGVPDSPGGKLAQLRDHYHLSQAQLGQIDPTSVTIKLATLGMRGVAANILWEKANDFKMKKDWTNLGAAQPNHQGPAELHQRVEQPGLEPVVQRLGRVRRLSPALSLGDEGHRLPQGRHQV